MNQILCPFIGLRINAIDDRYRSVRSKINKVICGVLVWLRIKVGRGQGDGDIGTRVWGLGTWGRETRDLRTSSMGRGDVWDGDAGTSNTGTQGTRDVNDYRKSRR